MLTFVRKELGIIKIILILDFIVIISRIDERTVIQLANLTGQKLI